MGKTIGICACYDTKNYGSVLQTLATVEQFQDLGWEYEIIRYTRKPTFSLLCRSWRRIPSWISGRVRGYRQQAQLNRHPLLRQEDQLRNQRFAQFVSRNFPRMSPRYDTFRQLQRAAQRYDAVLVGSDQLWNPKGFTTGFYTLDFVPLSVPKIAYATSFGVGEIPRHQRKRAQKFLNRIESISVRELRGAEMVYALTGRRVPTVVDPTMLLHRSDWDRLIPPQRLVEGRYVLCYFLGDQRQHRKMAEAFAQKMGCRTVTIPHLDAFVPGDLSFGDLQLTASSPEDFLNLIRGAAYVCTDSFHGTVFSLLYHKPFATFLRYSHASRDSRNSRIDSLLHQTGLEQRRVTSFAPGTLEQIFSVPIDYAAVDARISQMAQASREYLKGALKDAEEKWCGTHRERYETD